MKPQGRNTELWPRGQHPDQSYQGHTYSYLGHTVYLVILQYRGRLRLPEQAASQWHIIVGLADTRAQQNSRDAGVTIELPSERSACEDDYAVNMGV